MDTTSDQTSKKSVQLSDALISELDSLKDAERLGSREEAIQFLLNHRAEVLKTGNSTSGKNFRLKDVVRVHCDRYDQKFQDIIGHIVEVMARGVIVEFPTEDKEWFLFEELELVKNTPYVI